MGLLAYAISKFSSGKAVVIVTAVGALGCLGTLIALAVRAKRFGRIVGRVAGTLIAVFLGMYLVLFGLIYFFQDTIANEANAFFQPRGISAAAAQALVADDVEALNWTTPDGARLAGWLVKNSSAACAAHHLLRRQRGRDVASDPLRVAARRLVGGAGKLSRL